MDDPRTFEDITADTMEKMRDLVMRLYDEQTKIVMAHNELDGRVTELEKKRPDHLAGCPSNFCVCEGLEKVDA